MHAGLQSLTTWDASFQKLQVVHADLDWVNLQLLPGNVRDALVTEADFYESFDRFHPWSVETLELGSSVALVPALELHTLRAVRLQPPFSLTLWNGSGSAVPPPPPRPPNAKAKAAQEPAALQDERPEDNNGDECDEGEGEEDDAGRGGSDVEPDWWANNPSMQDFGRCCIVGSSS